jgi:hypothetical protein
MASLQQLETKLRDALSSDRLEEASALMHEYRRVFDATWEAMPLESRQTSPLPAQAALLMRWAHSMALTIRSAIKAQRKVIRALSPYQQALSGPNGSSWRQQG